MSMIGCERDNPRCRAASWPRIGTAGAGAAFGQTMQDAFAALASALDGAGLDLSDQTALIALIDQVATTESVTLSNGIADAIASVVAAGNKALDHVLQRGTWRSAAKRHSRYRVGDAGRSIYRDNQRCWKPDATTSNRKPVYMDEPRSPDHTSTDRDAEPWPRSRSNRIRRFGAATDQTLL
jgi:hypothetical protein